MAVEKTPPVELVQGTNYAFSVAFGDYDSTWALSYELRGLDSILTVAGVATTYWTVSITSTQTAALTAGPYLWQAFVSKGSERYAIDTGSLVVYADLATLQATATAQSSARKRLAIYQAMAENVAYIKTLSPDQMEALERIMKSLQWDVKREEDAEKVKRGINVSRKIYTRFISP